MSYNNTIMCIISSIRKTKMKSEWVLLTLSLLLFSASAGSETGEIIITPFCAEQIRMGEADTSLAGDKAIMFWDPAELGENNSLWHRGLLFTLNQPLLDSSDSQNKVFLLSNKPKEYEIGGIGIIKNHSQHLRGNSEEN